MAGRRPLAGARVLATLVPLLMLAGAFAFEHIGRLPPCEMCWWQRWAHFAALFFALASWFARRLPDGGRSLVWLAALAILSSALIGGYHAGVERGIFEGVTQCTASASGSAEDMLKAILDAPMIRCDQIPWQMLGISMAGWNAILSGLAALVILWMSLKKPVSPA